MKKKHAYLIMAHENFESLKYLIRAIDDERNDIFIHIDKKVKNVDFDEITSWSEKSNIYFAPRHKVYWGHISMVKAEYSLFWLAAKTDSYAYYHLLSGVDFPLKSQDEIHQFFDNQSSEFIGYYLDGEYGDDFGYKLKCYFPLIKWVGKGIYEGSGKKIGFMRKLSYWQQFIMDKQLEMGVDRRKRFPEITFAKGPNWVSITDDFVRYLLSQEKRVLKMFGPTNGPDEFYVQTVAYNSPFREKIQPVNFRYIDWNRGNPYEFNDGDIEELKCSDGIFARKISYVNHPKLVRELMEYIGVRSPVSKIENPLVSIVVPIYNVEKYLAECLDSLAAQTYTNIEVLLVDDGSKDGSSEVAKAYAKKDSRFKYIGQENRGLSGARNHGIDEANGEYLAFVDSDDWVSETYIETMLKVALDSDADVTMSGFIKENGSNDMVVFDEIRNYSKTGAMKVLSNIFTKDYLLFILAWNKLYKRKIFDTLRYAQGKIHEDEYAIHRVIDNADYITVIPDALYHYRFREDSITGSIQDDNLKHFHVFEAHQDRVKCCKNQIYNEFYNLIVYSMFEELIQLMRRYSDEAYKKNKLNNKFRKLLVYECVKNYPQLDTHQKKEYFMAIVSPSKYVQRINRIEMANSSL